MGWTSIKERLQFRRDPAPTSGTLSPVPPSPPADKKSGVTVNEDGSDEGVYDQKLEAGELSLQEATNGGLGRHLGIVSTTFLMSVPPGAHFLGYITQLTSP